MNTFEDVCNEAREAVKEYKGIPKRMYEQNLKLVRENIMLKKRISQLEFDCKVNKESMKEFKDNACPGYQARAIIRDIIEKLKRMYTIKSSK